jgi:hypothetical protein
MKVLVLNQMACLSLGLAGEGVVTVDEALGKMLVASGYAEAVADKKVERATKAPGEKTNVTKPKGETA